MTADPYVYPGSTVLRNLPGLRDQAGLARYEYRATWLRRIELYQSPVQGLFDLAHLCEVHRRLFQDVFDWAGELRTVSISKGSTTFFYGDWAMADQYVFGYLADGPLLHDGPITDEVFVANISELLARINDLHPFREGNGRAQRAFLDQVAGHSGRILSWRNASESENRIASIQSSSTGSGKPFETMMSRVIELPLDGLSPFDDDVYVVGDHPPTVTNVPPRSQAGP